MNVFQTQLFDFIEEFHPELMVDKVALKQLLEERADAAAEAYEVATHQGHRYPEAMEIANNALYQGFDFAPIELLTAIAERNGGETEEKALVELYFKVKSIFDKYQTADDDFAVSEESVLLETELEDYILVNGLFKEGTPAR